VSYLPPRGFRDCEGIDNLPATAPTVSAGFRIPFCVSGVVEDTRSRGAGGCDVPTIMGNDALRAARIPCQLTTPTSSRTILTCRACNA
jgi:hypothetical protein